MEPRMIEASAYSGRPRTGGLLQYGLIFVAEREREDVDPYLKTSSMAVGAGLRGSGWTGIRYEMDDCVEPGLI